jgi:hypothetical protein
MEDAESAGGGMECVVRLEIQGNDAHGYNLIMSPAGFFSADYWYETFEDALASAEELFGVGRRDWDMAHNSRL